MPAREKHSSLLLTFVNFGRKKFYNIGPRPTKAKLRRDQSKYFEDLDGTSSGKWHCLAHLDVHNLTADHLSELGTSSSHIFEATVTSQSPPDSNGLFGVNFRSSI